MNMLTIPSNDNILESIMTYSEWRPALIQMLNETPEARLLHEEEYIYHQIIERRGVALLDDIEKIKYCYDYVAKKVRLQYNKAQYNNIEKLKIGNNTYTFETADCFDITIKLSDLKLTCLENIGEFYFRIPCRPVRGADDVSNEYLRKQINETTWTGVSTVDRIIYNKNKNKPEYLYITIDGNNEVASSVNEIPIFEGIINKRAFYLFFFHEFNHVYERCKSIINYQNKQQQPITLGVQPEVFYELKKQANTHKNFSIYYLVYYIFTESERLAMLSEILPDLIHFEGNIKDFETHSQFFYKFRLIKRYIVEAMGASGIQWKQFLSTCKRYKFKRGDFRANAFTDHVEFREHVIRRAEQYLEWIFKKYLRIKGVFLQEFDCIK